MIRTSTKLPAVSLVTTLALGAFASGAAAQSTSLITLTNPRQSVDLSYRFDANQGQLTSTMQHGLQEDYRLSIDYMVYKARLLHGQASVDLQGTQESFSGQGKSGGVNYGYGILYDVNGVFLDRFPYPVNFFVTSNIIEIPREFASTYQQKNDTSGVSVSLNSRLLPVAFSYNRSSNETSGLDSDRIQVSETFSFGAAHSVAEKSQTQFTIFNTNQSGRLKSGGELDKTGNLEATLNNTFNFGNRELNRVLYTRWRIGNQTGDNESRSAELGEYLTYDIGKALTSGIDYTFSSRKNIGHSQQLNTSRMWLQHRLFKSLTTRLDFSGSHNSLDTGTEESASGSVSLSYQKLLPAQSVLHLQGHKQYGITSNRLDDSRIPVPDEPHTTSASEPLMLDYTDVVPESIVVRNADASVRSMPYVENRDYQVRQLGSRTEIFFRVAGSEIHAGDKLLISYDRLVNTHLTYSNTAQGAGGDITLFDNKYRFFANFDTTSQGLISGKADQVNLTSTDSYKFGFERRHMGSSLTTEYDYTTTERDKNQTISGYYVYGGESAMGRFSLTASERYVMVETNPLVSTDATRRSMNILAAGANYSRPLENAAILTASANAMDTRGTVATQNLSMALGVQWNLRRMTVSVITQANFRYSGGEFTSDEHLQFRFSRYF